VNAFLLPAFLMVVPMQQKSTSPCKASCNAAVSAKDSVMFCSRACSSGSGLRPTAFTTEKAGSLRSVVTRQLPVSPVAPITMAVCDIVLLIIFVWFTKDRIFERAFMTISQNVSLKPYNTFGIDAKARYFTSFDSKEALREILESEKWKDVPRMIMGGGSNILLTKDFDGLVLKNDIKGIHAIKEDDEHVYIQAGAGENWHGFVQYCIQHNLGGLENLSLIPGNVGASPMQNIGAYGAEIK
jgi:hypothetical protein